MPFSPSLRRMAGITRSLPRRKSARRLLVHQRAFNITLLSENAARPGTKSTLTLHGVKIEQWTMTMPEDDFVMEGATFQALYATVADELG